MNAYFPSSIPTYVLKYVIYYVLVHDLFERTGCM